jgi:thymidylate synthase (FAD)
MRLYFAPHVTLIARPEFLAPEHLEVRWFEPGTDGEQLAEFAGRLCYMSQHNPAGRTTRAYIKHILDSGHGSVLEHANYAVLLEGVSRSLTHELVRHRSGLAYSQLSQRFVDESDAAFVVPPALLGDPALLEFWTARMERALEDYAHLTERLMVQYGDIEDKTIRRKRAREAARSVLPNATETKIVVTGNVRAWRHVLGMRGDEGADQEINRLVRTIAPLLIAEAPAFFQDVTVSDTGVTLEHWKV